MHFAAFVNGLGEGFLIFFIAVKPAFAAVTDVAGVRSAAAVVWLQRKLDLSRIYEVVRSAIDQISDNKSMKNAN